LPEAPKSVSIKPLAEEIFCILVDLKIALLPEVILLLKLLVEHVLELLLQCLSLLFN